MSRFYLIFITAIIISIGLIACQYPNAKARASEDIKTVQPDISQTESYLIGGIGIGTSAKDVKSKMGTPVSVENNYYICDNCETWNYEDTWFFIYNGVVLGLSSRSTDLCLFNDICPNHNLNGIFDRLGEVQIWPASTDKPPLLQYLSKKHEVCWLWVFLNLEKDAIQELRLACQP